MLKNCVTLASKSAFRMALPARSSPVFSFSNEVEVASRLKSAVEEEIKYEESEAQDLTDFTNFFENQGWKINYRGIQVELEKTGAYDLRIIFNAKTPMAQNEEGEENQESEDSGDYS